jgi:riboflavin-specific deaminase-like protein
MRPYIKINFACSLDGRISSRDGRQFKFSNIEDLRRVHKMRAESDLIIVGKNTINMDDPKLVVNGKYYDSSRIPDVAVLDSGLAVSKNARIFFYPRKIIMFCGKDAEEKEFSGNFKSKVIIKKSSDPTPNPGFIIKELGEMGYRNIMIEGGRSVLTSFIADDKWDEISIFYSPYLMGEDGIPMVGVIKEPLKFDLIITEKLGDGFLVTIKKGF